MTLFQQHEMSKDVEDNKDLGESYPDKSRLRLALCVAGVSYEKDSPHWVATVNEDLRFVKSPSNGNN